jgi:hypothetical protein
MILNYRKKMGIAQISSVGRKLLYEIQPGLDCEEMVKKKIVQILFN